MRCAICGGSTLPAAKLCGACKAALKRARHETVSQLDPLPRRASRGRRGEKRPRPHETSEVRQARSERLRAPAGVVALGIVVAAGGYFVSHFGDATRGPDLAASTTPGAATPYVPLPTAAPRPLAAPAEPPAAPAVETTAKPAPPGKPHSARTANPTPAAPVAVPDPAPGPAAGPAEQVAALPQATAKIDPPAPDRWQLLAEAITRCGGGLEGLLCGERARWQYCEGYWGKVAQCPGAIGADFQR
jgi:hypothetical protein